MLLNSILLHGALDIFAFYGTAWFWMVLDGILLYCLVLDGVVRNWFGIGFYWMALHGIGLY